MATVGDLLGEGRRRLAAAAFGPAPREALSLLGHCLGLSEAQVLARDGEVVPGEAAERFRELLARRLAGEPVAYLKGEREFYGRPFRVDRRVLIPRPETEHLVEAVLARSGTLGGSPRVLDVGTGSGCVAVTLALELPAAWVVATDVSLAALAVAQANARRHGARVALAAADLTSALDLATFDAVVSNPPYVDPAEEISPEVRDHEPAAALFPPLHPTFFYRALLAAGRGLRPGALMVLEIGRGQLGDVEGTAAGFEIVEVVPDYAAIPRIVVLKRR